MDTLIKNNRLRKFSKLSYWELELVKRIKLSLRSIGVVLTLDYGNSTSLFDVPFTIMKSTTGNPYDYFVSINKTHLPFGTDYLELIYSKSKIFQFEMGMVTEFSENGKEIVIILSPGWLFHHNEDKLK